MLALGLNLPIYLPVCGGCLYTIYYIKILRLLVLRLFILYYLYSTEMLASIKE